MSYLQFGCNLVTHLAKSGEEAVGRGSNFHSYHTLKCLKCTHRVPVKEIVASSLLRASICVAKRRNKDRRRNIILSFFSVESEFLDQILPIFPKNES